jgi:hypothetical protein
VTFRTDYPRAIFLTLLCGFFIWLVSWAIQQPGLYERTIGWIGAPWITYLTLQCVALLIRPGPTIVISDTGILDRRLSAREIPWGDIAAMNVVQNRGARYLKLTLRDPIGYFDRMSFLRSLPSRIIYAVGLSPFCITFGGLRPGLDEAYAAITQKLGAVAPKSS